MTSTQAESTLPGNLGMQILEPYPDLLRQKHWGWHKAICVLQTSVVILKHAKLKFEEHYPRGVFLKITGHTKILDILLKCILSQ